MRTKYMLKPWLRRLLFLKPLESLDIDSYDPISYHEKEIYDRVMKLFKDPLNWNIYTYNKDTFEISERKYNLYVTKVYDAKEKIRVQLQSDGVVTGTIVFKDARAKIIEDQVDKLIKERERLKEISNLQNMQDALDNKKKQIEIDIQKFCPSCKGEPEALDLANDRNEFEKEKAAFLKEKNEFEQTEKHRHAAIKQLDDKIADLMAKEETYNGIIDDLKSVVHDLESKKTSVNERLISILTDSIKDEAQRNEAKNYAYQMLAINVDQQSAGGNHYILTPDDLRDITKLLALCQNPDEPGYGATWDNINQNYTGASQRRVIRNNPGPYGNWHYGGF